MSSSAGSRSLPTLTNSAATSSHYGTFHELALLYPTCMSLRGTYEALLRGGELSRISLLLQQCPQCVAKTSESAGEMCLGRGGAAARGATERSRKVSARRPMVSPLGQREALTTFAHKSRSGCAHRDPVGCISVVLF